MGEFQYVMKQWRRMCEKNHADCMRLCPICANPTCGELKEADDEDIRKAEAAIMAWAAEHPEPVYPTWEEWLVNNGVFASDDVRFHGDYRFYMNDRPMCNIPTEKIYSQIPADIAQKLGLQPKEG